MTLSSSDSSERTSQSRFRKPPQHCQCCHRPVPVTFHHLIPKKAHRRNRFKLEYSKAELNQGIHICRLCHRGIYRLYNELTLARRFNSLEQLLADAALARHFLWVSKQKERRGSPDWL